MQARGRYTTVAIVLHWLVAAIVLGQFVLGWWMQEIPKQPPGPRRVTLHAVKQRFSAAARSCS